MMKMTADLEHLLVEDPVIQKTSSRTKRKRNDNVTKDKSSKKSKKIRSENVVTAVHECKDCKVVFTRVDNLRRHMQNKLPNQTTFCVITLCQKQ